MQPYNADDFVSAEELKQRIADARAMKARLKLPLMQETNAVCREELERFEYRLAKYMYELKAHKRLNRHIDKALELVAKFRNQKPPENCTQTERDEWERKKLTPNKVLSVIRRYIRNQDTIRRKEIALVKTSYGFKLKAYAPRLLDKDRHNAAGINGLILKLTELPMPENPTEANLRQHKAALRLIRKKRHRYSLQSRTFDSMEPQPEQAAHPAQQSYGNPGQGYGGQYGYPQQPQGWPQQAHPNGGYPQYAHPNGGMMPPNRGQHGAYPPNGQPRYAQQPMPFDHDMAAHAPRMADPDDAPPYRPEEYAEYPDFPASMLQGNYAQPK